MARIRTVKPEHWNDKELPNISLQAHLLWIGMWNFSDDDGIIEADPLLIRSQVFPRRTDIRTEQMNEWIGQLVKARFVIPFEYNGSGYYIHRTFKTHQKIERSKPSKVPKEVIDRALSEITDESPTNHRQVDDESPNDQQHVGAVEERKVIVEERRGEDAHSSQDLIGIVIYDAEKEILGNQIRFEQICIKTGKNSTTAKEVLRKYHLWLVEHQHYPKPKNSVFAGFEKWLMNEKKQVNGTHLNGHQSRTAGGQNPTRINEEGIGEL